MIDTKITDHVYEPHHEKAGHCQCGEIVERHARFQSSEFRRVLDDGKHIIADMLHGVEYSPEQLQRWVNEAESVLLGKEDNAGQ